MMNGDTGGGGDENVRERSPLHEIGDRVWPGCSDDSATGFAENNRAKFRLRVGRRNAGATLHANGGSSSGGLQQQHRGPMVGRQPVKAVGQTAHGVQLPPPQRNNSTDNSGSGGKYRNSNIGDISSPESGRKSSACIGSNFLAAGNSSTFGGNVVTTGGGRLAVIQPLQPAPQRPSRLPIVSVYNPKMLNNGINNNNNLMLDPRSPTPTTSTRPQLPPPLPLGGFILPRKISIGGGASSPEPLPPPPPLSPKNGRQFTAVKRPSVSSPSQQQSSCCPAAASSAMVNCGVNRRTSSPKRGDVQRRRVSPTFPTGTAARRRSPSLTRSRPPSPGGRGSRPPSPRGPVRRNPSPSQLDPEQAEALRKRIGKARRVKLYLLQQSGSNSFLVAGGGEEGNGDPSTLIISHQHKYKVNIGPQICSCGKGPGCLHLLFIMLRVFKIPENDSRLTARELKEFEIEALFRSYEERKKTRVLRSRQQSIEILSSLSSATNTDGVDLSASGIDDEMAHDDCHSSNNNNDTNDADDDALCPICLSEMVAGEEQLTGCSSCRNSLHHSCMAVWTEECRSQGDHVVCPLCRSVWSPIIVGSPVARGAAVAAQQQRQCGSMGYHYFAPSPYMAPAAAAIATKAAGRPVAVGSTSFSSNLCRTSDTLHMIEQGGSPEDIPLPRAEPIPQQHWPTASAWIAHYGRDLVACLFSRDWVKRETGLRRLAREVVKLLTPQSSAGGEYSERVERAWRCCADMLAMMIEDKVYKVYLAAVKALRALLNFLCCHEEGQLQQIKSHTRPLLQSILLKCADGNKRISDLSTDTLLEISRGAEGEMALGKHAGGSQLTAGFGGLDYLLHIVLEERDLQSVSWQWIMGRLVVLDRLLSQQPQEFSLERPRDRPAAHQHFSRLLHVIQFSFQNLGSSHANVARLARRVFTLAARHTAADTPTFNQVWELLGSLDSTLQIRLRKGLATAIEELYLGPAASDPSRTTFDGLSSLLSSSSSGDKARTPQELDRSAFLEKFLSECSNQHTEMAVLSSSSNNNSSSIHQQQQTMAKRRGWRPPLMRSTSHSPSRQMAFSSSRSSSRSPSRANTPFQPQLKPSSLCQSVYNISSGSSGVVGPAKRPLQHGGGGNNNHPPWNSSGNGKPRVLTRLAQKSRLHELAREVLPKFDLSFINHHPRISGAGGGDDEHLDDDEERTFDQDVEMTASSPRPHSVTKSRSMSRLASTQSRNTSPTKGFLYNNNNSSSSNRSPMAPRKRGGSRDSGMGSSSTATIITSNVNSTNSGTGMRSTTTPQTSPLLLHRDKQRPGGGCSGNGCGGGGSCKDLVAYEESLALALALSKSLYHESPLPVIPGLSAQHSRNLSSQEVLAHPHRDIMEEGDWTHERKREYREGVDWTKGTVLGTGAYSTCYQARDVETGTLMAAKQISFCRNSDEEQDKVEQLIREEVLLLSKLQHPQIVRMYGAIQEGSHINVFEEWMPGGSIAGLLDRHGPFTESVILRYTHQILLGLDYLHANGVLHRDLKGANLLVDTSGHHLRIADFGAAARMVSKSTVPGEFQGQLQGTIAFMAPEVLRGDSYGRSCDIWSAGCCIIEMATARPPWGASDVSNHLALIFRIACAGEPPDVPGHLSPALRDLCLRCLELEPSLRPTTRDLLLHPVLQNVQ